MAGGRRSLSAGLPIATSAAFCFIFVALPLGLLLWESIDEPEGLGFSAWAMVLADPVDRAQLGYSLALGLAATFVASLLGLGYAWLTFRTDMPGAAVLGPLGIAPLAIPPILVAMGFADLIDAAGFIPCAVLLGISNAPFVAVLTARGLRSIDGRTYEAAWLARGRGSAERMLLRMVSPEILAGALLAFIFVISEHGVPEFLTVKGKNWHTYAEGVFASWQRRATGVSHEDIAAPIVAALPLVAVIAVALALALRLRAHASMRGDFQPLPLRRLGRCRLPALLWPVMYLGAGVLVPVVVMGLWAAGSTDLTRPMSLDVVRESFRSAFNEAGDNLSFTVLIAACTAFLLVMIALPLARLAARRRPVIDKLSVIPLAVPAILLGIGFVRVFNSDAALRVYAYAGDFYDS
ncbi:MAG: ABC transporter permease, partial [Planctomycetota bacterium]